LITSAIEIWFSVKPSGPAVFQGGAH
jgi:hypothetical protein